MGNKKDKARAAAKEAARKAARKQAKRSKRGGSSTITPPDGIDFFKPKEEGSMTFSILGFVAGKNRALLSDVDPGSIYYKVSYRKHGSIGPEEKHVVCPSTFAKRCPMEEEFAKQNKGDAEWDDIKGLRPSDRDLFIVVHNNKLYLWDVPWWWFGKLLDIEIEEDDGDKLFWFPEDGMDVRASFETDSYGTKATSVRFKKRKDDIDEELIEQAAAIDLSGCVNEVDYEEIKRLMHGVSEDEGEEPDEEPNEDPEPEEEKPEEPEPDGDDEPKCFGKEFDGDDDDCEECDHRKDCKKAMKKAEKEKPKGSGKSGKSGKGSGKKDDDADEECKSGFTFGKDFDEEDECDDCAKSRYAACEKANKKG